MNKNLNPNSLEDVFNVFDLFQWFMDLYSLIPKELDIFYLNGSWIYTLWCQTKYQFSTMATANAITTNLIGAGLTES